MKQWYAACDKIMRMGPFRSEAAAWRALELSPEDRERQRSWHARGARVWPEDGKGLEIDDGTW